MTQYNFGTINPDNKSGTDLANDLNMWRNALHSSHRGATRPSYAVPGTIWIDDSADPLWKLKLYNGTTDVDLGLGAFTPASATGPASLTLAEDTDNGANKIVLKAPDALSADRTLTLPDKSGVLATIADIVVPRGHLFGLTLSNNGSDVTNDIDLAQGEAASDGATAYLMTLAAALTKRMDAAWAVGSGNGGLDTGAVANGTYHKFLIQRSDTGVVDALFSLSPTTPTMPANYDRKRRIGSIIRASGAIVEFRQKGDRFLLYRPALDVDLTSAPGTAAVLYGLTVPTGVEVDAMISASGYGTTANPTLLLSSPAQNDNTVSDNGSTAFSFVTVANQWGQSSEIVRTDTSGRVRARASQTMARFKITTKGWIDNRGQ